MSSQDRIEVACELQAIVWDLNAVICMVKDEQPCNQILCKIGLIRQALRSLRRSLIAHKIQDSILVIQNHPDSETQMLELSRLQDFYREMIQNP